jgi:hypothetical protein
MLKRLGVFAVAAFVAVGMSGQPNKTANDKKTPTGNKQSAAITLDSHDTSYRTQQAPQKTTPDSQKWYAPLKRPDWWLVLLGFGTLGVILWQTQQTKKAADAALLNAQAVINSERAWIAFSIDAEYDTSYRISIHNHGRCPARINYLYAPWSCVPSSDELPLPPAYPVDNEVFEYVLHPGQDKFLDRKELVTFTRIAGFDWEEVRTGSRNIQLICCLRYSDGVSPEPRETRIAFRYNVPRRYWETVGGVAYNQET